MPLAAAALLAGFGLRLVLLPDGADIPGTYWGEPEAGLSGDQLFVRPDTPVHSLLHEAAHFLCMPPGRRAGLHRDAGGDVAEEDAVCYLQVLLGAEIRGAGLEPREAVRRHGRLGLQLPPGLHPALVRGRRG